MPAPRPLTGDLAVRFALDHLSGEDRRFGLVDLSQGMVLKQLLSLFGHAFDSALTRLIRQTAISFDNRVYATVPVLRPYAIRDRSKRGGAGKPELWGVPRHDGYFSDDNSLLKKLPHSLDIASPDDRFHGRRVTTGWTACHAWRALDDGRQSSALGLLNSFAPVLIWVPSALSTPTDVEGSRAQHLLKGMARSFQPLPVPAGIEPYTQRCWRLLGEAQAPDQAPTSHRFAYDPALPVARVKSIRKVAAALHDVSVTPTKVLASRYTSGLAALDPVAARNLAAALFTYAQNVEHAVRGELAASYVAFPE